MKNTVSIIIPIYNAMPFLPECLESISTQDYDRFEVLLINNGSTDDSLKVCREYEERFDFVHTFNISSASIGTARNFGLSKAKGDLIMFIDADDFLPGKEVLRLLVKKIVSSDADICVGNFCRLWNGKLLHATSHRAFSKYTQSGMNFLFTGFFSIDVLSYVWAKLYKADFIKKNGLKFTDSRYAEDKLFNLQAAACNTRYSFLKYEVYVHRHNPLSISFTYRHNPHHIWLDIARHLKDFFKDKPIPMTWQKMIAYTIFFGCFFDSKMEYRHSGKSRKQVKLLLTEYGKDELSRESFKLLSDIRNLQGIPSALYRLFIGGFAWAMRLRLYSVLSFGIKLLIDFKIDEMLSDTGKKPSV